MFEYNNDGCSAGAERGWKANLSKDGRPGCARSEWNVEFLTKRQTKAATRRCQPVGLKKASTVTPPSNTCQAPYLRVVRDFILQPFINRTSDPWILGPLSAIKSSRKQETVKRQEGTSSTGSFTPFEPSHRIYTATPVTSCPNLEKLKIKDPVRKTPLIFSRSCIMTPAIRMSAHIMTHNFVEVFGRFNVTICLTARESPRRPIL